MSVEILGEVGNVLVMTVNLGSLLDGTSVTSAEFHAISPIGEALTWEADIETASATLIVLAHELLSALMRGGWYVRPVLFTGSGVRVQSIILRSVRVDVVPDPVTT